VTLDVDILDGIPTFYNLTGTGCINDTPTVIASSQSTVLSKKDFIRRGSGSITVAHGATLVNTSNTAIHTGMVPTCYNETELLTLFNVTVSNASSQKKKKDLFTYPNTGFVTDVSAVGVTYSTLFLDPTSELLTPNDMGPNYYIESSGIGGGLYFFYSSQDYLTGAMGAFFQSMLTVNPNCMQSYGSNPMNPYFFRFDHEAQRFVMFTLNQFTNTMCAALSLTEDPAGSWTIYDFGADPSFVYSSDKQGFELAIWGDFYHVCTGVTCFTFERDKMLLSLATGIYQMDRNTLFPIPAFPFAVPAVHPTHQNRGGPRTSFMTTDAPCGVFSTIEASTGSLVVHLCQSINFTSLMATYNTFNISITGSWDNYVGQPCDCAQLLTSNKNVYSDHVHSAYDKAGNLAWAWQSGGGATSNVGIAWTEITTADLLTGPVSLPRNITYPQVTLNEYFFSPSLTYDCWGTLFLNMLYGTSSSSTTTLYTTYKLASDPALQMRTPSQTSSSVLMSNTGPANGFSVTYPSSYTGKPRPIHVLQPFEQGGSGARIYIARQTHQVQYFAQDFCGNNATCTQTIELFTNTSCLSA
jgi:hypothetical protein